MIFPFPCCFLSIFYFKLFVAEYRPNLDTWTAHTETIYSFPTASPASQTAQEMENESVCLFFQWEPQMERSTSFPCQAAAQGPGSLLQGACPAPAEPGQGCSPLAGRWWLAQPSPKGRFKDCLGRKRPFGWPDVFSCLWLESRSGGRLNSAASLSHAAKWLILLTVTILCLLFCFCFFLWCHTFALALYCAIP